MSESIEQTAEKYSREIHEKRYHLLESFYLAFCAQKSIEYDSPIDIQNIVLVEKEVCDQPYKLHREWHFEYRDPDKEDE